MSVVINLDLSIHSVKNFNSCVCFVFGYTVRMSDVLPIDRAGVVDGLFSIVREIEQRKGSSITDIDIRTALSKWEVTTFNKFGKERERYLATINEKKTKAQKQLNDLISERQQTEVPPQPPIQQPTAAVVHRGAPPPGQLARPSAPAAPSLAKPGPQTIPKHMVQSSTSRPPTSTIGAMQDAPPRTALASPPPGSMGPKWHNLETKKLEDLRDPLEECRSILRVVNVFGMPKRDQGLKDEFLKIFQRTTETIKQHKTAPAKREETDRSIRDIFVSLKDLRIRLEPKVSHIMHELEVQSLEELFELDTKLFGIMDRFWQLKGKERFQLRLEGVSEMIGSEKSLKRVRTNTLI